MSLTADDFREKFESIFSFCNENGIEEIVINAGKLHRAMGDYPDPQEHRMATLSTVMRSIMEGKDREVTSPQKGKGASLSIRYSLPRRL